MIPQETIDRVLEANSIAEVVGEYVALRKSGANYTGCCPFHNERTASFVVSPSKGIYKCFGCGAAGNVVKFIQEQEQLSFPEAVRFLGKRAGIAIEDSYQPTPEEKAKNAKREAVKAATAWAQVFFVGRQDAEGMAYLASRTFKHETVAAFGVGYAPNDWHALQTEAEKAGYKKQALLDASLIGESDKGTYDYFRGRIIFPIHDVAGNVVGFTGRAVAPDEKAKYLNSKDTELFSKGRCLFGLHLAKKAIVQQDSCYLLEGNFDVIRFHELGFTNTIAACGTALTKEQVALIRRFTLNVTLVYDGDSAGEKATFRNAELLLAEGMNVRMIALPEGQDPDSYGLSVGADVLKQLLQQAADFVSFKYEQMRRAGQSNPIALAAATKELTRLIALIPERSSREHYVNHVAKTFKLKREVVANDVNKAAVKPVKENAAGWTGLDMAREAIKEKDKCYVTTSLATLVERHANGEENTIAYFGTLDYSNIQELNSLTRRVEFVDNSTDFLNRLGDNSSMSLLCLWLLELKFDVIVRTEDSCGNIVAANFLSAYADACRRQRDSHENDEALRVRLLEQCCDLLCLLDEAQQAIYTKTYADALGVKEADLKKLLKPKLAAKKSKHTLKRDAGNVNGRRYDFDIDKLPDYVDKEFFHRWGYFPAQDENGRKIFYVFRSQDGGLSMVGNFYIEPLFHVYDPDKNRNKRVVRINNADSGATFYTEFLSENLVEFGQFKKMLFNEGGNVFSRGKSTHHEVILASIANEFPKCWELNDFGQQHEGFYAFANAIYADGAIHYTDELGLVKHKDKVYYSPAFSKIYSELRKSNDRYENDRWFVYKESNDTDFTTWARLMVEVYRQNNNGHWALLYAMMSTFRSVIFPINRLFTAPFFIGPTESGKTQIAVSIRALFMHPEAPLFNLNSGTDAAFFTSMERYRDVAMVYEEYNDNEISDIKFQGLKAAVYDGEGKQKKKDATSKDLDISKVNCATVLLGQEAPQRDDGSLANRCILLHVPKKDDWTDHERAVFDDLRERQKKGLSGVLLSVLQQRTIVEKHYEAAFKEVYKSLKKDLADSGDTHQSRIVNTVSLFLAMCKVLEQHVPTLRLPFKYEQFYKLARAQVVSQSEMISSTNRLSVFFETLELLLVRQHNGILLGREFKLEWQRSITLQSSRTQTTERQFDRETRILYLRLGHIQQLYADVRRGDALTMSNLLMYLKDHPAYIGSVKSTRFDYVEYGEQFDELQGAGGRVVRVEKKASANSSAVALDYELLQELTGIDLEKHKTATPEEEPPPPPVIEQQSLEFSKREEQRYEAPF